MSMVCPIGRRNRGDGHARPTGDGLIPDGHGGLQLQRRRRGGPRYYGATNAGRRHNSTPR